MNGDGGGQGCCYNSNYGDKNNRNEVDTRLQSIKINVHGKTKKKKKNIEQKKVGIVSVLGHSTLP